MTERKQHGGGSETRRRTMLAALGTAVAAGPFAQAAGATTDAAEQALTLHLHVHEDCTSEDIECASRAATLLSRQFNERFDEFSLSWTITAESDWSTDRTHLESEWEGIPEGDTDGPGIHAFLLRGSWQFDNGYGHRIDRVTADADGATVANVGAARFWDGNRVAANLIIHEVLHALGADHADGEVTYVSRDRGEAGVYTNVSPMSTAYVRYVGEECDGPFRDSCSDTAWPGSGTVPDTFSNGTDNFAQATAVRTHTTVVADAAWDSVGSQLAELENDLS
ncbi:hypothetical protein [Halostella pelagica]|uniref:hypothetical protein n=1 Tax=Halostella pelagica TaxID=2583824 RepID=UPI001080D2E9|nr:hypothetical protein [Halostella pelagica]